MLRGGLEYFGGVFACGFVLLLAELGVVLLLRRETLDENLAARDPRALGAYGGSLVLFALLPAAWAMRGVESGATEDRA